MSEVMKQFAAGETSSFESLQEGMSATHNYTISEEVYQGFLEIFDDRNPLHTDPDYARAKGFKDRIMFGGTLNGFLSHFIGMCFPGKKALLLSTKDPISQTLLYG